MKKPACCSSIQRAIFGNMERFFGWFGQKVAKYPHWTILAVLVFAGLLSCGFLLLESETEQLELWVPTDSDFYRNNKWIGETFPSDSRGQTFIMATTNGQNILTKANLLLLHAMIGEINSIKVPFNDTVNITRSNFCARTDPCRNECSGGTILDLWRTDNPLSYCNSSRIENNLNVAKYDNEAKILERINEVLRLPIFSTIDINWFLGGVERDETSNNVTKATAFNVFMNHKKSEEYPEEIHAEWESKYLEYLENLDFSNRNLKLYRFAARSVGDEFGQTVGNDAQLLSLGFMVVFIYVVIMLGQFNVIQCRGYLSLIGIGSVGLGIATAYGLCGIFGVPNTPMNSILPFLLLGIGIDDMFVIVQSFSNIQDPKEMALALAERFGLALKHAGVAITITSMTDLMAFGIGATTVLPALQSFCIFAAIGIFFVFIYMVTFFLAFFTLDQRRIENFLNGFCCCYKHKNWTPNACSQKSLLNLIFTHYANILIKLPFKIGILCLSFLFLSLGCYGVSELTADFDFKVFLNEGTYLRDYFDASDQLFPTSGINGEIYVAQKPNIHQYIPELQALINETKTLRGNSLSEKGVSSFLPDFISDVGVSVDQFKAMSKADFDDHLLSFLKSNIYAKWRTSFKFENKSIITDTTAELPNIIAMTFGYNHVNFKSSSGYIKAMNDIFDICDKHQDKIDPEHGRLFAFSGQYSNYVTIEIITSELLRNIILATVCIFLVTLLLLTDVLGSILVLLSIVLTLIDVAGFMHLWGLKVDTITALLLTVAMGLAVDYSAHIAHYFMTALKGDRNERIRATLINIGPAVLNGGFSTFLAFVLLMTSSSYIFKTFFKIFFLVVAFGLYHGIVFLPVILSLVGPSPHDLEQAEQQAKKSNKVEDAVSKKSANNKAAW